MDDRLVIMPGPIQPSGNKAAVNPAAKGKETSVSFGQVLDAQLKSDHLKFSRHATMRMEARGISFDSEDMTRLKSAVSLAESKGAKDSLVLLDSTALVVSVKNNTVVTVVDNENLKGNVFTKIDSAVIA